MSGLEGVGGGWDGGWDEPGVLLLLLIAASIPGSGLFVYSGTPEEGDLFVSVTAAAGDDIYDNPTVEGVAVYDGSATYIQVHVNTTAGAPAIELVTGAGSEAEHGSIYSIPVNKGAVNELIETNFAGPGSSHDSIQGWMQLVSAAKDGSSLAGGVFYINDSGTFTPVAFWNSGTGFSTVSPGGADWTVNGTQTDTSQNANANQASATALSKAWTVPANDANAGTIYELEVPFDALFEGNNVNLGLSIDGSSTFTIGSNISGTIVTAANSPNGNIKLKVQVLTTGSSGTFNAFIDGTLTLNGTAITPSTTWGFAGNTRAKGGAIDTTKSHTFRLISLWGGSNASQTITGYGSKFTRSGP